jgi:predicted nucleic acid-binding protein
MVSDLLHDDNQPTSTICEIRATKKLKLPDAIVAASAMHTNCALVTADQKLLQTPGLTTMSFPLI